MNQEDFMNSFRQWQAGTLTPDDLYKQMFGEGIGRSKQAFDPHNDPFAQFGQRRPHSANTLNDLLKRAAAIIHDEPIATDPKARRDQINKELDIVRGVVPTPKGYKVDPLRAKALMAELKKLPK